MKRLILLIGIFLLNILLLNYLYNNVLISKRFIEVVKENDYVLHALGSINGDTKTNSIDALEMNYKDGFKIYEVDISLTSDDKLVLASGWNLIDYKSNIGIKYYNDSKANVKDTNTPSYKEFMNFKIQDKYTATDYKTLIKFMNDHKDTYFIFDIGGNNDATNKKILDNIIRNTNNNLYKRIIIDVYNEDMMYIVKSYKQFKLISIRYNKSDYNDIHEFIDYCKKNKVISISTTLSGIKKDEIILFKENNIITIIRDINNIQEKELLNIWGVDLISTDILR